MFNSSIVHGILVHSDLRPAENGGLVHIVPGEEIRSWARIAVELELGSPIFTSLNMVQYLKEPLAYLWVKEI